MKIKEISEQMEDIIIDKYNKSKIECYEIPIKIPNTIEPGSKLEVRYLNYLIQKYSKNDCDTIILLDK